VAHSLSAKKRIRQTAKRRARNRFRKDQIKSEVKGFTSALTAGNADAASDALKKVVSRLDKVAAKGTIHKKTAARKRSRLAKRLNALRSGAGSKGGAANSA
jgi:small subunit ribosomal protein S20